MLVGRSRRHPIWFGRVTRGWWYGQTTGPVDRLPQVPAGRMCSSSTSVWTVCDTLSAMIDALGAPDRIAWRYAPSPTLRGRRQRVTGDGCATADQVLGAVDTCHNTSAPPSSIFFPTRFRPSAGRRFSPTSNGPNPLFRRPATRHVGRRRATSSRTPLPAHGSFFFFFFFFAGVRDRRGSRLRTSVVAPSGPNDRATGATGRSNASGSGGRAPGRVRLLPRSDRRLVSMPTPPHAR